MTYRPGKYLIRRHGAWFRPGAHGYSSFYGGAGIFDRDKAVSYTDVEGLTIHHIDDLLVQIRAELAQHEDAAKNIRSLLRDAGVDIVAPHAAD
jgi:hypothetical protein